MKDPKLCAHCKQSKSLDEYYSKGGKYPQTKQAWCKSCINGATLDRIKTNKIRGIELLGGQCSRCGYNLHAALDFHHLEGEEKEKAVSHMRSRSFDRIKIEILKCILLCSNCHREFHAGLWNLPLS